MAKKLQKKRVAILVTDGFEQDELAKPRQALDEAGALTEIVSPKANKVKGWKYTDWGEDFRVDCQLSNANPDDYDALLLPGGQMNPDSLRLEDNVKLANDSVAPIVTLACGRSDSNKSD